MRAMIERYIKAYNAFDVEGMLQVMAPEVVFENVSGGERTVRTEGVDALRELALQSAPLFKSRKQTILGYREESDRAFVDIAFEGVFAVDLPGGIRAGQTLSLQGQSEFHVDRGRITYLADRS